MLPKGKGNLPLGYPTYDQLMAEVSLLSTKLGENQEAFAEFQAYYQSQDSVRRTDFEKYAADIKIQAVTRMSQAEDETKLQYGRHMAATESSIRAQVSQMQSRDPDRPSTGSQEHLRGFVALPRGHARGRASTRPSQKPNAVKLLLPNLISLT